MNLFYKLDENKNVVPATLEEWNDYWEERLPHSSKHIGDEIINDRRISTVFIGLINGFNQKNEPLLFESMIFDENGVSISMNRYATYKEAEEGHKKAVQFVEDGCKEDE